MGGREQSRFWIQCSSRQASHTAASLNAVNLTAGSQVNRCRRLRSRAPLEGGSQLTSSSLCFWLRALSLRCTWLLDPFSASLACSSASLAAAAAPAAVFFFRPICRHAAQFLHSHAVTISSQLDGIHMTCAACNIGNNTKRPIAELQACRIENSPRHHNAVRSIA